MSPLVRCRVLCRGGFVPCSSAGRATTPTTLPELPHPAAACPHAHAPAPAGAARTRAASLPARGRPGARSCEGARAGAADQC